MPHDTTMFRRRRIASPTAKLEEETYHGGKDADHPKGGSSPSKKVRWNGSLSKLHPASSKTNLVSHYLLVSSVIFFTASIFFRGQSVTQTITLRPTDSDLAHLQVIFKGGPPSAKEHTRPFYHLRIRGSEDEDEDDEDEDEDEDESHSYGGLEYWSLEDAPVFSRRIDPDDREHFDEFKDEWLDDIDSRHFEAEYEPDEDIEDHGHPCKRNNWKAHKFPTCNSVHELTLERPQSFTQNNFDIKYLGHGHFRDAWLLAAPHVDEFVFKRLRLNDEFNIDYWDMHKIHREAIIMERLTASPRIISMFGFCSTTILSEAMGSEVWKDIIPGTGHAEQEDLDEMDDVYPRNNYTAVQKLDMAIEMSEALADMHGFDGGVMLHGDTHPEQWLLSKDGRLILNDFNNAEILDFNSEHGEYCKTYRRYGGFYRAPEEYVGIYIDEGVDTFSLGNNIYCLLTGLWPFYPWTDYQYIQHKLLRRERAYVDPRWRTRSFIEGKLVDIMEQTWEHDPNDRITIFQVIDFLLEAKQEYLQHHKHKQL